MIFFAYHMEMMGVDILIAHLHTFAVAHPDTDPPPSASGPHVPPGVLPQENHLRCIDRSPGRARGAPL